MGSKTQGFDQRHSLDRAKVTTAAGRVPIGTPVPYRQNRVAPVTRATMQSAEKRWGRAHKWGVPPPACGESGARDPRSCDTRRAAIAAWQCANNEDSVYAGARLLAPAVTT